MLSRTFVVKSLLSFLLGFSALLTFVACSEQDDAPPQSADTVVLADGVSDVSDGTDGGDASDGEPQPVVLQFGIDPIQSVSAAPFPNDLYRTGGGLTVSRLVDDPLLFDVAAAEIVAQWSDIINTREGFGSTSPVFFFATGLIDEASLQGNVTMVSLAGRDAGREVRVQTWFDARWNVVGVYPAWGDFMEPGSTYAVMLNTGITSDGVTIAAPETLAVALTEDELPAGMDQLRDAYAPLRTYLAASGTAPEELVGATVFTTQEVYAFGESFFSAADTYELGNMTRRIRWDEATSAFIEAVDIEGDTLDVYFGPPPTGDFEFNPGIWTRRRDKAQYLPGFEGFYEGGNMHNKIARVINGSIEAPAYNYQVAESGAVSMAPKFEDGKATTDVVTLIPFTLVLCDDHIDSPTNIPVALFSHGGGAQRIDMLPWANLNCLSNVATIATDMPYHGGRRLLTWLDDEKLLVPVTADVKNDYTDKEEGDDGYLTDYVGDRTSAAENVGPMYALNQYSNPDVVEGNLITYAVDVYIMTRYIQEADWSVFFDGLSFDADKMFHYSLSFGTTFTTAMHAFRTPFKGIIGSVGSSLILSANMTNGPANSAAASGVLSLLLGLKSTGFELSTTTLRDVGLGLHQWLHERGDSQPYAPYVLRYQQGALTPTLHSGNSWDETLFNPAQLSYQNALGIPVYTYGSEWTVDPTVPGSENIVATESPAELVENAEYDGETTTAGMYYLAKDCHAQVVVPICTTSYEHPYPPVTPVENPVARVSPICALQHQMQVFLNSLLEGGPAKIVPPDGDCESLYGN